jgi:hypothetical protein
MKLKENEDDNQSEKCQRGKGVQGRERVIGR